MWAHVACVVAGLHTGACADSRGSGGGAGPADASVQPESSPPGACIPGSCIALQANCGRAVDGCGNIFECGTCELGQTCGAAGPNLCGVGECWPESCLSLQAACGLISNGCDDVLSCGQCPAFHMCDVKSAAPKCQCEPQSCLDLMAGCGQVPDRCGGVLECGTCPGGQTCGAGGPNLCGVGECSPKTCLDMAAGCGLLSDGCGGVLDCGQCDSPLACGGGGVAYICGCQPRTCAGAGVECGPLDDGCGVQLDCGQCAAGQDCGSVTAGRCSGEQDLCGDTTGLATTAVWPMTRYCGTHAGRTSSVGPSTNGVLWSVNLAPTFDLLGESLLIGEDGTVYVEARPTGALDPDSAVAAIEPGSGDVRWTQKVGSHPTSHTSLVAPDVLLFATNYGRVLGFASDGGLAWDRQLLGVLTPGAPGKSTVIFADRSRVSYQDGIVKSASSEPSWGVFAVDHTSQSQRWRALAVPNMAVFFSATLGFDDYAYVANVHPDDHAVYRLGLSDGKGEVLAKLSATPTGPLVATPDGRLLAPCSDGRLIVIATLDGTILYDWGIGAGNTRAPALDGKGSLYVSAGTTMQAIRISDGHVHWSIDLPGEVIEQGPIIDGAGTLFASVNPGGLHAISAETGEVLWTVASQGKAGNLAVGQGYVVWQSRSGNGGPPYTVQAIGP